MKNHFKDIDSRSFYINLIDPDATFNKIEITLAHLFREKMPILGNRNYSECLFEFLQGRNYFKKDIIEIGCGLGDLALNFLKSGKKENLEVGRYIVYDISPSLIAVERNRLGSLVNDFICADCLELSKHFSNFDGMILSNAMIADLRSVYISKEEPLESYDIYDSDLIDFANEWANEIGNGYYFHVGALKFLREICMTLAYGGTAIINEYTATELNQPSVFGDHLECGIDFLQISAYAKRLGFQVEMVDIEEVLGFSYDQEFLSVDIFTMQDKVAKNVPMSVKLWRANNLLPVLGYTRDSLRETLASDYMCFSTKDANTLVQALDGYFHSIHDPRFDHKNPTTWGYKCLLLRKVELKDWEIIGRQYAIPVLAEVYSESEEKALERWQSAIYDQTMSIGFESILEQIIVGLICDLIKKYGPIVWKYHVVPSMQKALSNINIESRVASKTMSVLQRIILKK